MNPAVPSPARRLTALECDMHERMAALVAAGDLIGAARVRRDLLGLSAYRSEVCESDEAQEVKRQRREDDADYLDREARALEMLDVENDRDV